MTAPTRDRSDIATYLATIRPFTTMWSLVTQHAVREITQMPTQRMMGAHIEHLQALYRGALALPVPDRCGQAHVAFLFVLKSTIAAYLVTAEQRSDEEAHRLLLEAIDSFAAWNSEVARLERLVYPAVV